MSRKMSESTSTGIENCLSDTEYTGSHTAAVCDVDMLCIAHEPVIMNKTVPVLHVLYIFTPTGLWSPYALRTTLYKFCFSVYSPVRLHNVLYISL